MVFDAHMHVGDFPMFGVSLDGPGLQTAMDEAGVDDGVVFHPDNDLVARTVSELGSVHALFWANPRSDNVVAECSRLLDREEFVGVKLHPLLDGYHPNDPAVHPIMEVLRDQGGAALIHCGHPIFTLPWSIEELVVEFPDVPVILGHMGHGNIIYINAAIDVAARNANVYLETSGMPMHTKIVEAVHRVGRERVLFGSDAPFHDMMVELLKVRRSGLSDDDLEWVEGRSAEQLFLGR